MNKTTCPYNKGIDSKAAQHTHKLLRISCLVSNHLGNYCKDTVRGKLNYKEGYLHNNVKGTAEEIGEEDSWFLVHLCNEESEEDCKEDYREQISFGEACKDVVGNNGNYLVHKRGLCCLYALHCLCKVDCCANAWLEEIYQDKANCGCHKCGENIEGKGLSCNSAKV